MNLKTYRVTLTDKRHVFVDAERYEERDNRYVFHAAGEDDQFFMKDEVVGITIEPDPPLPVIA